MKISVVIPNYNGAHLLEKNLPLVFSALESSKEEFEVIVVDDFSEDESLNILENIKKEFGEKLRVFKNDRNYGFSTTVNNGAKETKGEFLLLLNSDVKPHDDFIKPLLLDFKDKDVFAVGCLDESVEDGKVVARGKGKGSWKKGFLSHSAAEIKKGSSLWVSGGSGMFRKEIWQKLGGLRGIYNPFYWEDIDISYRALKSGYKVLFEPKSKVVHEHEKGAIQSKYSKTQVKKIAYRNQILFVWQNADFKNVLFNIFFMPYHILKTVTSGDAIFLISLAKAFTMIPKVLENRNAMKKFFVINDEEVVKISR